MPKNIISKNGKIYDLIGIFEKENVFRIFSNFLKNQKDLKKVTWMIPCEWMLSYLRVIFKMNL